MTEQEQKITPFNKVIVTISGIHKDSARPWVDQYIVSICNSVDNIRDHIDNNSDDIPGYYEKSEREGVLRLSKRYLHAVFMRNLKHVKVEMEEE